MADRSNLPAPYESPWRQLGRASQAVLASLQLDLRGLWRRNRAGELGRPGWWPAALGPLFWPLLLTLVLGLLAAAAIGLASLVKHPSPGAGSAAGAPSSMPSPAPIAAPPPAEPIPAEPTPAEPLPPEPPAAEPSDSAPGPATTAMDALRTALGADDSLDLIMAINTTAEPAGLQLKLGAPYRQLDPRRQRRLAETWLERSLDLGFEQLELIGPDGRLLGYRARVGSGMILLAPGADS